MIDTRVARILGKTQVVLSAGSDQGVTEGMEFVIYKKGTPVVDPENGQILGELEIVKGRVKVSHVQPTMSVATTLAKTVKRYNPGSYAQGVSLFRALGGEYYSETIQEELVVDPSQIQESESDLTVRIGDLARSTE